MSLALNKEAKIKIGFLEIILNMRKKSILFELKWAQDKISPWY